LFSEDSPEVGEAIQEALKRVNKTAISNAARYWYLHFLQIKLGRFFVKKVLVGKRVVKTNRARS
jgi:hypothetical protein